MSGPLFIGHLAPIGRIFETRITGEGRKRIRLQEFALPLASRAKVRVDHGTEDVGEFSAVIRSHGWFVGSFQLNPDAISDETAARIKPGMPLSIGMEIIRSEPDRVEGVEHVLEGRLYEVSICREGLIDGAKITSALRSTIWRDAPTEPGLNPGDTVFYGGSMIRRYFPTTITVR